VDPVTELELIIAKLEKLQITVV